MFNQGSGRIRTGLDERRLHADPCPCHKRFTLPNTDPSALTWTGPPPGTVIVQPPPHASLAASLFASFPTMLGKQRVNRYTRNRGGSAADKSRDRQRKRDGLETWRFHLVIESLPVMRQFALLLLGCALSWYLSTISHPVAGVVVAATVLGVISYVLLALVATLHYNCPYQTPPTLTRAAIRYLTHSDAPVVRSLRSLKASFPSIKDIRRTPRRLGSGVRSVPREFGYVPALVEEAEHVPLAVYPPESSRTFSSTGRFARQTLNASPGCSIPPRTST